MVSKVTVCALSALTLLLLLWGQTRAYQTDLVWSTFLGGSSAERGWGIAVDDFGNAYVTGTTYSVDFPTTAGALDTTYNGGNDVFVAKLNISGSALDYATFLGGSAFEAELGIAVDDSGSAYVTGWTQSVDFPTTAGAFDTSHNGYNDAFVVKLNVSGSALDYATFLGGDSLDQGRFIAVDGSGNAYVSGSTDSDDFPVTAGAFDTSHNGVRDAFVVKLNVSGSTLDYATFLGGSSSDRGRDIAPDDLGNAFVLGGTVSVDFPTTAGSFDTTHNGGWDGYAVKLNATGSGLDYATFLGGSREDWAWSIATDDSGNVYVTGCTGSYNDFPTTAGAFDTSHNGGKDAFVVKLNVAGSALNYATFLGGNTEDFGQGIALDGAGNVYVTGQTASFNFPTTAGAFDETYNGDEDVFVAKLNSTGSALEYATFLGGNHQDYGRGIALDNAGKAYVAGGTESDTFPVTVGAFDITRNGVSDAFVAKLNLDSYPVPVTDLAVTLAGEGLVLEWSELTCDITASPRVVDLYRVYRDTVAFFEPDSQPLDSVVELFYLDTSGVVGDTLTHYYYAVTAVCSGKESGFSRVVGEFDTKLTNLER